MNTQLKEIILLVLENSDLSTEKPLSLDLNLRDDLGLDSLALAELTVRIEDAFKVDIFKGSNVQTIEDIMKKLNHV